MLSINQTKLITSLKQKKFRDKTGFFVAEGPKIIGELLDEGLELHWYFTIEATEILKSYYFKITEAELKKISFLKTPNSSLAVFKIPQVKTIQSEGLIVILDSVRDPGNLGTIIRLCDWFGVEQIVCAPDTADCFNPKVVQATMGSLARVQIHYKDLSEFLENNSLPVYGGCMDGKNIYSEVLPANAIIVMGNEANGVSTDIMDKLTHRISIPRFGKTQRTESLNVATATGIILSEFRRFTGR